MAEPTPPRIDASVVSDRLALALDAPERAASWHWLCDAVTALTEPGRRQVAEAVRRRRPASGVAAVLAATFLDALGADESELGIAAHAYLASSLPLDAGLALLNVTYARSLRAARSSGFVELVRRSGFLAVSRHVGLRLIELAGAARAEPAAKALHRVAVVAPTLSTGYHAPTQMALAHACLLNEQGLEVGVFAPQEHLMPGMAQWLGAPRQMALAKPDRATWQRPARGKMNVALAVPELSMRGRWLSLLEAIGRFGPQAVLFVGPYSPLLWPLQARYPVVGLGTNALPPVGPLDLWLAPGEQAAFDWAPELPAPRVREHTQRLPAKIAAAALPRKKLGLPESAVVWMTSGYSARAGGLTLKWCTAMRDALERQPNAYWLVVLGSRKQLPDYVSAGHPRVIVAGFQKDFGAALLASDLYLNPPRMGGGHSVALAMAHGVPALALAGGDGGNKVGESALPDETALFETLDAWTRNASLRREAGARQRERFRRVFDLTGTGATLVEALAQASAKTWP